MKGLYLLFAEGKRPVAGTLDEISRDISFINIIESNVGIADNDLSKNTYIDNSIRPVLDVPLWMEFLVGGMTFDLSGLSPGRGADLPEFVYRFDSSNSEEGGKMEGLMITPGPHLSGAERTTPVVRAMVRLAASFSARLDGLIGVGWGPSRSMMGLEYFSKVVGSWLEGGAFPALGLTAFTQTKSGGLVSEGLGFFTGQELAFGPELAADPKTATRLGIRLVNELIGMQPVSIEIEFS